MKSARDDRVLVELSEPLVKALMSATRPSGFPDPTNLPV